jgi:hypothetical protein
MHIADAKAFQRVCFGLSRLGNMSSWKYPRCVCLQAHYSQAGCHLSYPIPPCWYIGHEGAGGSLSPAVCSACQHQTAFLWSRSKLLKQRRLRKPVVPCGSVHKPNNNWQFRKPAALEGHASEHHLG